MILFVKNTSQIRVVLIGIYLLLIMESSPYAYSSDESYISDVTSFVLCSGIDYPYMYVHLFSTSEMVQSCCGLCSSCQYKLYTIRLASIVRNIYSSRWIEFFNFVKNHKNSHSIFSRCSFLDVLQNFNKEVKTLCKNSGNELVLEQDLYKIYSNNFLDIKYKWIECDNKNNSTSCLSITKPITSEKDNDKSYFLEMDVGLWGYPQYRAYRNMLSIFYTICGVGLIVLSIYGLNNNIKSFGLLLIPSIFFLVSAIHSIKIVSPYRLINIAILITTVKKIPTEIKDDNGLIKEYLKMKLHYIIIQLFSSVTISCLENIQKVIFMKSSNKDEEIYAILQMYSSEENENQNLRESIPNQYKDVESAIFIPVLSSKLDIDNVFYSRGSSYATCKNVLMAFYSKELTKN